MAARPLKSKSASNPPWLWFIAGPNGAGKSTWTNSEECKRLLGSIPILNPDIIVPNVESPADLMNAGRQVLAAMDAFIAQGQSCAVETTLSGKGYLRRAHEAKAKGWKIGCVYIWVDNVKKTIKRIEERKRLGGHGVDVEDVKRRYPRSLEHLESMFHLSDYLEVFDNSTELTLLLELEEGEKRLEQDFDSLPHWLKTILEKVMQA